MTLLYIIWEKPPAFPFIINWFEMVDTNIGLDVFFTPRVNKGLTLIIGLKLHRHNNQHKI